MKFCTIAKRVLRIPGILILLLSLAVCTNAQQDIARFNSMPDTRIKADSILRWLDKNRKKPSWEQTYHKAFNLIEKLNYKEAMPALYDSYGVFKRDISQYPEAIAFHLKALALAKEYGNIRQQIISYNNLGVAYRRMDDYNTALDNLMPALTLSEKSGDDYSVTIALNSIGNIHLAQGNYRAAINYFQQCMPIALKANNERGIAINMQNMGECYERLGITDTAKLYYTRALAYNKKRKDDKGIAICYISLGTMLLKKGSVNDALNLYQQALAINMKLGDRIFIANSYNNIGNAYLLEKDYTMAKHMFDSSLFIATAIGSVSEAKDAYNGLRKIADAQQMYKDAYTYSLYYKQFSDSISNVKNAQTIRGKELAYHQKKFALLESNNRNDRIIMIGGLILLLLLLVSGVLYYLRYRLLERNRSLQRELEIRSQIASDLHDDMGSSLSSIHIFSELLRKDGDNKQELLSKIEANAKDTLEALDDIIWLVKPSNDKFSNLSTHISEFCVPLFESKNIDFEIDFPESIAEIPLPMETRRNIFLIIKESVNNLVKYSDCTKACICVFYENNNLCFKVTDNGKGFDPSKATNRNGVKNLKVRAAQIGADIKITSTPGSGTIITLFIKSKEIAVLNPA